MMSSPPDRSSEPGRLLLTLRYDLHGESSWRDTADPVVLVELSRNGTVIESWSLRGSSFGWPADNVGLDHFENCERHQNHEPDFRIPPDFCDSLQRVLAEIPAQEPLWLYPNCNVDWMAATPWERLVAPCVNRPLLRCPLSPIIPAASVDPFELLLCASSPTASDRILIGPRIEDFVSELLKIHAGNIRIHVFSDAEWHSDLLDRLRKHAPTKENLKRGVIVYDPAAARDDPPPRDRQGQSRNYITRRNPWLEWMRKSLGDGGADAAHFICHGRVNVDQGNLAFAESPTKNVDPCWARFVDAQQLTSFAIDCGLWSIGFSSLPGNYSPIGTRLLAAEIARARPGFTYIFERRAETASRLVDLYEFLFQARSTPPATGEISLYCPPDAVKTESAAGRIRQAAIKAIKGFTLNSAWTKRLFSTGARPAGWVLGSQRYLEQCLSAPSSPNDTSGGPEGLSQEDINHGVKFAAGLIREFAASKKVSLEESEPSGESTPARPADPDSNVSSSRDENP